MAPAKKPVRAGWKDLTEWCSFLEGGGVLGVVDGYEGMLNWYC